MEAHRASRLDHRRRLQGDVKPVAEMDKLEVEWDGQGANGDWDIWRADGPVTDVSFSEQHVAISHVSEKGRRIWITVRSDVMSLLELAEYWYHTYAIKEKLGHEDFDKISEIEKQAEKIADLRCLRDDIEWKAVKMSLFVQTHTIKSFSLEGAAKKAGASSARPAGGQAACTALKSTLEPCWRQFNERRKGYGAQRRSLTGPTSCFRN